MTLKKSKKGQAKGQTIFEYFILTTVVVAVVLFFTSSKFFSNPENPQNPESGKGTGIKEICERAFNTAVDKILPEESEEILK